MKRTYLPFGKAFKMAMQGKWITRIITVILSAFSFALFSLASCSFTYNKTDYLLRGYLYYVTNTYPYTTFRLPLSASNFLDDYDQGYDLRASSREYIDLVLEETGWEYANVFPSIFPYTYYMDDISAYTAIGIINANNVTVYASTEMYEALGITALDGRFPENADEIAVSENIFEILRATGYYQAPNEAWMYSETTNRYLCDSEILYKFKGNGELPGFPIEAYSDLIGKKFMMYGDPEVGGNLLASIREVTVVGIIGGANSNLEGVYVSESWKDAFAKEMMSLVRPPITTKAEAKTCLNLTYRMTESFSARYGLKGKEGQIGCTFFFRIQDDGGERLLLSIFCGAGVFFGIFSVLLNGHLVSQSIEEKQKKIGVLRSLGASDREIMRIFIMEALFIAFCCFLLGLVIALPSFYQVVYPLFYDPYANVCMLAYNFWNVLILAVICFVVPLLSTIAPLKKFFRKPIVDNITGNAVKRKERNRA